MKIQKTLIAALAGVAMCAFTSPVLAQYKPTGDDGITASPKLRERLDERHRNEAITAEPQIAKMPCPKCTNSVTTRVDYTARGANKPTIQVVTHLCDGCETSITTAGTGKHASDVVSHKCTSCGAETLACCNTTKGSKVATTGMEKENPNFQVAPIK